MQDLADEVRELMDKATDLKQLWVERSGAPGKSSSQSACHLDTGLSSPSSLGHRAALHWAGRPFFLLE